jgi:hypothetical protein
MNDLEKLSRLKHPNNGVPSFRVPIPTVPTQKLASGKEREHNNESGITSREFFQRSRIHIKRLVEGKGGCVNTWPVVQLLSSEINVRDSKAPKFGVYLL